MCVCVFRGVAGRRSKVECVKRVRGVRVVGGVNACPEVQVKRCKSRGASEEVVGICLRRCLFLALLVPPYLATDTRKIQNTEGRLTTRSWPRTVYLQVQ